ncbi:MAG: hypothetical protein QOJ04_4465 [Caballeronia sp.]|jgi:ribulose-5-phosphate 4-epimerase/fuculose-1-phosphate aldolase|nr:hypothetical protein [Caballeronia sp.]
MLDRFVVATETADALNAQLRVDLAAAFRLAAAFDWHESVGNHLSVALSPDGRKFLMNPRWKHFAGINAYDLLSLDSDDLETMQRPNAPDPSAWAIHSRIHAALPHARCILHLHPPYSTALSTLADPTIHPIDGNTARFYGRTATDLGYDGIADDAAEGDRLVSVLADKSVLIMGNHGVLVVAPTIAAAFEDFYFLEKASKTLVLAYSTGKPLNVMSPELAARTSHGWTAYSGMATAHFAQLKQMLDESGSTYASLNREGRCQSFKL